MSKERLLEALKTEIETKRKELNLLVVEDIDKDEVLKFSVELDRLIDRFYNIQLCKK